MPKHSGRTLVLGIGNLLMGDEGIGVHAVRSLQESPLPLHVDVVDGGTGGFHLVAHKTDDLGFRQTGLKLNRLKTRFIIPGKSENF